jgi:hypothetical protein
MNIKTALSRKSAQISVNLKHKYPYPAFTFWVNAGILIFVLKSATIRANLRQIIFWVETGNHGSPS